MAPLILGEELGDKRNFVLIRLANSDRNALFHGLLKQLRLPAANYSDSQSDYINHSRTCKLLSGNNNEIEFIGQLSAIENDVLSVINQQKVAEIRQIADAVAQTHEEVHDALRELCRKGFVIDVHGGTHRYYSYYNFIP